MHFVGGPQVYIGVLTPWKMKMSRNSTLRKRQILSLARDEEALYLLPAGTK
jgi:hypothetical protein